jgi:hypothetical protein
MWSAPLADRTGDGCQGGPELRRHSHADLHPHTCKPATCWGRPGFTPQGYLSHGVVPRIFLGGEVDVIPEIGLGWNGKGFSFGNGLRSK